MLEVSEDGQAWSPIGRYDKVEAKYLIDLKGKGIKGRHIRLKCEGKTYLHLDNLRVFGRRLS